jgi:outer membrane protein assembly factor BamB
MRLFATIHSARARRAWLFAWLALSCPVNAPASDWPGFRGPNHDGISPDRLNRHWTGSVTNPVWSVFLTNGITSLTTSGGRVFTQVAGGLDLEGFPHTEYCVALDAANGAVLWATEVEHRPLPQYLYPNGGVGYDDGPRSTPVVDGDSVYVLSSYLKLHRLNASNGAVIWTTNLPAGFGGSIIAWQNAASPVVDNGLVFVNANAGTQRLMALSTSDGTLAWRSQDERMTHATPVLASIHGVRQVVFATQNGLVALDPQTGTRLWRTNHPFSYSTSLGVSPLVHGNLVFVSGSYNMGSAVTRVNRTNDTWSTTLLWSNASQQSHWMTPVVHNGFLYGPIGSGSTSPLLCIELATGALKWSVSNFGRGAVLKVGEHLLGLTERGALVLMEPNPAAYTELARFQAIRHFHADTNKCWNAPAVANGRVYVRSTAYAAAFDLSLPSLKLDSPLPLPPNQMQLTLRAADGSPLSTDRLARLEVRAGTNLAQPLSEWARLTNALVLTNGVARLTNVDASPARQYFIVNEPN